MAIQAGRQTAKRRSFHGAASFAGRTEGKVRVPRGWADALACKRMAFDSAPHPGPSQSGARLVFFDRRELSQILTVYGRMVAAGHWRDYALDALGDAAVFSIFRRASEIAMFRIEKTPALARRQGAWSVTAASGLVMKRGHELARVLAVLEKRPALNIV